MSPSTAGYAGILEVPLGCGIFLFRWRRLGEAPPEHDFERAALGLNLHYHSPH
jgi:hypothetical protein